jgi:hypothetical protein
MTAAHDYEELYHLVDRLSPGQARRLLALAKSDPQLADVVDTSPDDDALQRFQSFVGSIDSGRGDLSERHEEIIRDGFSSLA